WRRLLGLARDQRVWIAGSTHRGEEEAALTAHASAAAEIPGLTLVLAPRHPERVNEVLSLIASRGLSAVRRSALPGARRSHAGSETSHSRREPDIIVVDTVGELAQMYTVADVVFLGGSLVPHGGHNVLDAALRRKPVLVVAAGGYRVLLDARDWHYARGLLKCRAPALPVVSLGNLPVGGTGKTPAVELAVRTLMEHGHRPAVVSRGEGRGGHVIEIVA